MTATNPVNESVDGGDKLAESFYPENFLLRQYARIFCVADVLIECVVIC